MAAAAFQHGVVLGALTMKMWRFDGDAGRAQGDNGGVGG